MTNNKVLIIGSLLVLGVFATTCTLPQVLDYDNNVCLNNSAACTGGRFYNQSDNQCQNDCPLGYMPAQNNGQNVCDPHPFGCNQQSQILYIGNSQNCLDQTNPQLCNQFLVADANNVYTCLPICPDGFTQGTGTNSNVCTTSDTTFSWVNHAFINCNMGVRDVKTLTCLTSRQACTGYYSEDNRACLTKCPVGQSIQQGQGFKYCLNQYQSYNYLFVIPTCTSSQIYDLGSNSCLTSETNCNDVLVKDASGGKVCWPQCPKNIGFVQSTDSVTNKQICTAPSNFSSLAQQPFFNCPYPNIRDSTNFGCNTLDTQCQYLVDYERNMCVFQCQKQQQIKQFNQQKNLGFCWRYNIQNCQSPNYFDLQSGYCFSQDSDCKNFLLKDANGNKACWLFCPQGYTAAVDASGNKSCTAASGVNISKQPFFNCPAPMIKDAATLGCISQTSCSFRLVYEMQLCTPQCPNNYIEFTDPSNNIKACLYQEPYSFQLSKCNSGQFLDVQQNKCISNDSDCKSVLVKDANGGKVCWPSCLTALGYISSTDSSTGQSICTAPAGKTILDQPFFTCIPPQIRDQATLGCLSQPSLCTNKMIWDQGMCGIQCPTGWNEGIDPNTQQHNCYDPNKYNTELRCTSPYYLDVNSNQCFQKDTDCNGYLIKDQFGGRLCYPFCLTGLGYIESTDSATGKKFCTPPSGTSIFNQPFFECQNPRVRDVSNLGCLSSQSNCTQKIVYEWWTCFSQCPPNFSESVDPGNGLNVCHQGGNNSGGGNNYQMASCTAPQYLHYMKNSCITNDTDCYDYVIKDANGFKLCWPSCPTGYTIGKDQTSGVKTCTPPATVSVQNAAIFNCASPKVKDISQLNCLNDMSGCQNIIVSDRNQCVSICPNGYVYGTDQNNKPNCWNQNGYQCLTGQIWHYLQMKCINPTDCKDYVFTDNKGGKQCLPQCPDQFTAGTDSTNNQKTCTPPSTTNMDSLPISNCNNPLIRDFKTAGCFTLASQCTGYLVNSFNCLSACPSGYQMGRDQNNQNTCYLPYIYQMAQCSGGSYLNYSNNSCNQNDTDCKEFLIQDSNSSKVCWPNCPSGFTLTKDSATGVQYCKPPATWLLSAQPFFSCTGQQIGDINTFQCLTDSSKCAPKLLIKDRNHCSDLCLNGYVAGTDENNMQVCWNWGQPKCSQGQAISFLQNNCIPISNCKDYILNADKLLCIPDCPSSWVKGLDSINNVKTCSLPSGQSINNYPIGNCNQPQTKDFTTGQCLKLQSDCKTLLVNNYNCVSICPDGYQQGNSQNGQPQCYAPYKYQMQNCVAPNFLQFDRNNCISKDTDCHQYVVSDSAGNKICWPNCPSQFIASTDSVTGINSCKPSDSTLLTSQPIFNNCAPPKVWEIPTMKCLSDASQCTMMYVSDRYQCTDVCFGGYIIQVDNKTGKKYCTRGGEVKCNSPQIQNYLQNSCQNSTDCKDYILSIPNKTGGICIPDCPSSFIKGTDANGNKTCVPPDTVNMDNLGISMCGQPHIRDFTTAACLNQQSDCKGYLVNDYNCVSSCPSGYQTGTDSNGLKICYTNSNSNSCQVGQIKRIIDSQCILPQDCKEFLFQDPKEPVCIPECPSIFVVGKDTTLNVITCSTPAGTTIDQYPIKNCSGVRDLPSAGCLANASLCKGIYMDKAGICISKCPVDFYESLDQNGNKTCYLKMPFSLGSCTAPNILDIGTNNCIAATNCTAQLITDSVGKQVCLPSCPSAWQGKDASGKLVCNVPSTFNFDSSSFAKCANPGIYNLDDLSCLDQATPCKGYLYKSHRMCQVDCSINQVKIIDPKTGIKYCMDKEKNGGAKCDDPFVQNFIEGTCSYPELCPYSLLQAAQGQICIPQCPSVLVKGFDVKLNVQTCLLPAGKNLTDYPFANCDYPNYRDFTNGSCLTSPLNCKGFIVEERKACISLCPSNWQQIKNASGYVQCVPPIICQPSQILDTANKVCLDNISQCQGVINKQAFTCDASCPAGFQAINDSNLNVKFCVPCFYKDDAGNCYEKCPYPLLSVASSISGQPGSCLKDTTQCQGYFTSILGVCEATCRYGFTAIETTLPKSCVPCSTLGTCANQSVNSCNLKLSSDKTKCDINCPFGEIALPQVSGQPFQQCQKCPSTQPIISIDGTSCKSSCESTYVVDAKALKCIDPATCSGVIFTDPNQNKFCLPNCPLGLTVVQDASTGLNVCQACSAGQFFDPIKKSCLQACKLMDATGSFCILSINDCNGSISSDSTQCLKNCPSGQYQRPSSRLNQFQCVVQCQPEEFVYNNTCLLNCPSGTYNDNDNKTCSLTKPACKGVYSIDGQFCLSACPAGQYPYSNGNVKKCKVCLKKLSADGQQCADTCGSGEFYDLDLLLCVKSENCASKIIQPDGKSCSSNCLFGQILSDNGVKKSCLNSISECKQLISSDLKQCISACNAGEAQIQDGTLTICITCRLGVSDDGKSCRTSCASNQLYDADNKACVSTCGQNQLVSANGKNCVSSCVYPDLKRSSDNTKCYNSCGDNEVIDKALGCITADQCKTNGKYVSSNGNSCIDDCNIYQEFEDPNNSHVCKKCDDDSFARIDNGKIVCQIKSNDKASDLNQQADTLKTQFTNLQVITPEIKEEIKQQVQNISSNIEQSLKETLQSSSISSDDKKKVTLNLIKNLQDIGKQFISKIDNTSSISESEDSNKLVLGTDQFQYVAEKKKVGFVFSVSFSATDFYGASPDLQKDTSKLDLSQQGAKIDGSISSLSVTNQASNPHCSNSSKCGSVGLFSVDLQKNTAKKRFLQADPSSSQFTLSYNVEATKIDKTVCVTYDPDTSAMSPSLKTTADKTNNKIICTFTTNNSLYYDSDCSIVNSSLCPSGSGGSSTPSTTTTVTPIVSSSYRLVASLLCALSFLLI